MRARVRARARTRHSRFRNEFPLLLSRIFPGSTSLMSVSLTLSSRAIRLSSYEIHSGDTRVSRFPDGYRRARVSRCRIFARRNAKYGVRIIHIIYDVYSIYICIYDTAYREYQGDILCVCMYVYTSERGYHAGEGEFWPSNTSRR